MKDIAKIKNTEYLLEKYHLYPNKKFGQNFLIDMNTIKKIVQNYQLDQDTCVIEIGPGIGALTEQLALHAKKVIAYEIDISLKEVLKELQSEYPNVEIIFQDILTVDLKETVKLLKKEYNQVKIIANLPYYITSDILEHIIESDCEVDSIHAMVQEEVADKLTHKKTVSPLTLKIDAIGYISKDLFVSRNVFYPAPHVDSAIISIYKQKSYNTSLTYLLQCAFTQKRKTIYNNLKAHYSNVEEVLEMNHIDSKIRPEQLSIQQYQLLNEQLKRK